MIRKLTTALAVAGALFAASCGDLLTGGPLLRPGEPTGILRVENRMSMPMGVVLISDCDQSTYGLNRLPEGYAIPSGGYYDFQVSAGCWDVSAGQATGTNSWVEARQRMQVMAGGRMTYSVSD